MATSIHHAYKIVAAIVIVLVLLCAWAPLSSTRWTLVEDIRSEVVSTASDTLASSSEIVDGIYTKENMKSLPFDIDAIPANKKRANSEVIDSIKKFVFFVGYARSGHSIVGSLMDAHPHVVIAHEFFLFKKFDELEQVPNDTCWRDNLFQTLYKKNIESTGEVRSSSAKGYTLKVDGLWEGTYDDHIEVIGDKSGGMTTLVYQSDKQKFKENFEKLKQNVQVPLRIIHVLRNPFDMISTSAIYATKGKALFKQLKETGNKTSDPKLSGKISYVFNKFRAVTEIINDIIGRENVLDIHNCDLVADPRGTLTKIFNFLEVNTTEHYLDVCAEKVFKSVSRSRDLMEWPPELREMVETKMKEYEMLSRYSFTSD